MKTKNRQLVTEVLATLGLEEYPLDLSRWEGHCNIRVRVKENYDYNQDDPHNDFETLSIEIVGDRPETDKEYEKRLEVEKKRREKKRLERKAKKESELKNTVEEMNHLEKKLNALREKAEKLSKIKKPEKKSNRLASV